MTLEIRKLLKEYRTTNDIQIVLNLINALLNETRIQLYSSPDHMCMYYQGKKEAYEELLCRHVNSRMNKQ